MDVSGACLLTATVKLLFRRGFNDDELSAQQLEMMTTITMEQGIAQACLRRSAMFICSL